MRKSLICLVLLLSGCGAVDQASIAPARAPVVDTPVSFLLSGKEIESALSKSTVLPVGALVDGAVSPHHVLAVSAMADLFRSLAEQRYETVVIIGPDHYGRNLSPVAVSGRVFATPFGELSPDTEAIAALDRLADVRADDRPFEHEHALHALTGFVKKNWPQARLVPVLVRSDTDRELAEQVGYILAAVLPERSLVLASCDFSHHTDAPAAVTNDRLSLAALRSFDSGGLEDIAVDSPKSLIALFSYLRQRRSESFTLVNNTNAAVIMSDPDYDDVTSYIAGYFSAATENAD